MTKTENLDPCPNPECESTEISYIRAIGRSEHWYRCKGCGHEGPHRMDREKARIAWNSTINQYDGVLWVFLDENGDVEDLRVEERRSRSKKERWKGTYKYNHRRSDKGRCVFRLVERSEAWKLMNKLLSLDLSDVNREWLEEKDINALYRIVKTPRRRYGNFSFREDQVERLAKDYDMFLRTDGDFGRDDLKKAYDALLELQDS